MQDPAFPKQILELRSCCLHLKGFASFMVSQQTVSWCEKNTLSAPPIPWQSSDRHTKNIHKAQKEAGLREIDWIRAGTLLFTVQNM